MKKRRMKLMALALTLCVGATSIPNVWAAAAEVPVAEESITAEALADFQAEGDLEEMVPAEETEEAQDAAEPADGAEEGFITDDSLESIEDSTDTEDDSLLTDTEQTVVLGTDAQWQDVDGSVTVPSDTVSKRLYKMENGSVTDQYFTREDGLVNVQTSAGETYTYIFDEEGLISTGFMEVDGSEYFFILKNMVTESDSDLCPQTGRMQKDYWVNMEADTDTGREWLYFGTDGAQTAGPDVSRDVYVLGTDARWVTDQAEDGTAVYRLYWNQDGKETNRYFSAADGLITVQDTAGAETRTYAFDPDGKILEGLQEIDGNEYYFTTQTEAGGTDPAATDLGIMVQEQWVLLDEGKTWGYFGADGSREEKSGYVEINGAHYYLDEDGAILTGHIEVDGKYLYFSPLTDPIGQESADASMVQGWIKDGDAWKYVNEDGTIEIRKGIQKIESGTVNSWMCLDEDGVPMKNELRKHSNGKWYYFGSDGIRVDSQFVTVDCKTYYFGSYGARASYRNTWKTIDKKKYYFGPYYYLVKKTGWQKIGSYWYYFSSNGNMQHDRWITQDGKKYYVNSNGVMYGGLRKIDGKYYYFKWSQGNNRYGYALTNRWVKTKGYWYYASADGSMLKSRWLNLNGNSYYLDGNCRLVTNKWCTKGGKNGVRGYVDSDGVFRKANTWVNVNGNWRYLKDGAKNGWATGWTRIDGYKYYFKSNGDMQTDLSGMTGFTQGPYRYDVNRQTCTVTVLGKDENGKFTVPVIAFACSVGLSSTPTPLGGPYTMQKEGRWQMLMGPSWGQYGTHLIGAGQGGIYFHSVAGSAPNHYSISAVEYNKLGSPASHGCIRLTVRDAKWIWDHWGSGGNTAYIHDSASNIFYKPSVPKIGAGTTYDPTDPAI